MTPVVRLYWIVALLLLPLSLIWLGRTSSGFALTAINDNLLPLMFSLVCLFWTVLGGYELFFSASNLRRNYPVLSNLRYLLEFFRPEIQQYFISNNQEERPFSRERRNMIYQRAKGLDDTIPFGTEQDILAEGYRSLLHSFNATEVDKTSARVTFGGPQCSQPYCASRLNISAMSFGSLSGNAIEALNKGARLGDFIHNTGEGGISPHHLKYGGDLIWQIGTGYFGCRTANGRFDDGAFRERAATNVVKMFEIKISQGAKPSHGGVLPGAKVTEEIAAIRMVEVGKTVNSPPVHPEFSTPVGLLEFVQRLREATDGKPIGFKFCLSRRHEFLGIIKAILETGILPDFITVDGSEGGTGAAPPEFTNRLGVPCLEATYYVNQVLLGCGLRKDIKLISSGLTGTGFDMLEKIALGANTVNTARAMMLALGCIQARHCNTNRCPTGVATQDPFRTKAVDVDEKALRVKNFHHATVEAFLDLCGAMGVANPDTLTAIDLYYRSNGELQTYPQFYAPLANQQLLGNDIPESYRVDWNQANSMKF
ncbi:MAG: FMN-binding glutamate synthase family protein [Gammaproteobacteria bacterium]|nr:FMN-binding glutamate synthase family protein [Gammaproteobacteria bacterium]